MAGRSFETVEISDVTFICAWSSVPALSPLSAVSAPWVPGDEHVGDRQRLIVDA
jgi:hypothetical protein